MRALILCLVAGWLAGCATTVPTLSQHELADIKTVFIDDQLGTELSYVQVGTTMFQGETSSVSDASLFQQLRTGLETALSEEGFALAEMPERADYVLRLTRARTENLRTEAGVDGAGFFTHTRFGFAPGVEPQIKLEAALVRPDDGTVRQSAVVERRGDALLKGQVVETWDGFSEAEQKQLLDALRRLARAVPGEVLDALGLRRDVDRVAEV